MSPLNISPKVSAAALAGSLVTVGSCVAQANGIHIDPGVAAAAAVIAASLIGYIAPHSVGTPDGAQVLDAMRTIATRVAIDSPPTLEPKGT